MKLSALVEGVDHVCYRYRIEAFAWALAERGLRLEAVPLRRGTLGRIRQLRAAGRADVVILQRKLLPIWQLRLLRRAARRLIYDFDDALFQRDSYHRKAAASWQRTGPILGDRLRGRRGHRRQRLPPRAGRRSMSSRSGST